MTLERVLLVIEATRCISGWGRLGAEPPSVECSFKQFVVVGRRRNSCIGCVSMLGDESKCGCYYYHYVSF